jgi:hypothetical protein
VAVGVEEDGGGVFLGRGAKGAGGGASSQVEQEVAEKELMGMEEESLSKRRSTEPLWRSSRPAAKEAPALHLITQ